MLAAYTPNPGIGATDPALPDGPPANLAAAREALDNRRYLRGSTWGLLIWSGRMEVSGTAAAPVVALGAIEVCVLRRSSGAVRAFYDLAGSTLGAAQIEGGGALAADDWYYVYAINAGTDAASTMTYEISQTGPTASGVFKNDGAATELKRYLGCFPTDSAGNPIPLLAVRGSYRYRRSAVTSVTGLFAADGLRAVAFGGGAVARTALDLSARVPPHARRAILFGQSVVTSTAAGASTSLDLYDAADTTSVAEEIVAVVANNTETARAQARAEVQLTSAQLCGYAVVGSGGLYDAAIDLMGWEE